MRRALFLLMTPLLAEAAGLRAAVVKVDITPEDSQPLLGYAARRSTGVHDHIYHRVLALDDGTNPAFYLVATDIALISPSVYDDFARTLERETGIRRRQLWWTNTHTHSAPEVGPAGLPEAFMPDRYKHPRDPAYTNLVLAKLLAAIHEARSKLEPARLSVGAGFAMANINRRARDVDGKIKLGLNPYGPTDRQIGLLRVERADGRPLAIVANYAIHGTAMGGQNLQISGDVPGTVAAYVEEKLSTTVLFVNGATGDLAPIYSVYPDYKAAHLTEFNVLLGDRILEALRELPAGRSDVKLRTDETIVETPRKAGLGWTPDLAAYTKPSSKGDLVKLPVVFLAIDDEAALWGAPLELFCEIALDVRRHSPFRHTFFFGYTNGWLGYLPTKKAYTEGGYEINTAPFTDAAEQHLREAVLGKLAGLR